LISNPGCHEQYYRGIYVAIVFSQKLVCLRLIDDCAKLCLSEIKETEIEKTVY